MNEDEILNEKEEIKNEKNGVIEEGKVENKIYKNETKNEVKEV